MRTGAWLSAPRLTSACPQTLFHTWCRLAAARRRSTGTRCTQTCRQLQGCGKGWHCRSGDRRTCVRQYRRHEVQRAACTAGPSSSMAPRPGLWRQQRGQAAVCALPGTLASPPGTLHPGATLPALTQGQSAACGRSRRAGSPRAPPPAGAAGPGCQHPAQKPTAGAQHAEQGGPWPDRQAAGWQAAAGGSRLRAREAVRWVYMPTGRAGQNSACQEGRLSVPRWHPHTQHAVPPPWLRLQPAAR